MTKFAGSAMLITICPRCQTKFAEPRSGVKLKYSIQCCYCKAIIQMEKLATSS